MPFLKISQQDITNLIIKYLVDKKVSRQYKNLITATLKHACEINDIVLNWKKIKKFVHLEKTGNETNGRDRGYTHEEIQKILGFCDQRIRTAFLLLTSTGIRIGALQTLKLDDLEKIDDFYKVTVYKGDKEEYFTFCTPECAKAINTYLDFRRRRGEKLTDDSYLIVKKFGVKIEDYRSKPFNARSLRAILEYHIIKAVNTIAENKKLDVRFTSLFELREISIDSRVDLNKLKEDTLNGKRRTKNLV